MSIAEEALSPNSGTAPPMRSLSVFEYLGETRHLCTRTRVAPTASTPGGAELFRALHQQLRWRHLADGNLFQWGPLPFALSPLSFPGLSFLSASLFLF